MSSRVRVILATAILLLAFVRSGAAQSVLHGDIIFQDSDSAQTPAIQLATKSKYSHCGIILMKNGKPHVFEAADRVKFTPLQEWIDDGAGGHYVVMRLRDRDAKLSKERISGLHTATTKLHGKPYDLKFLWSDDKIYCSELVWKIYEKGAGIKLTELKRFRDYDLSAPKVKAKLRERFGEKMPLDELVVAPVDILNSPLLVEAARGGAP